MGGKHFILYIQSNIRCWQGESVFFFFLDRNRSWSTSHELDEKMLMVVIVMLLRIEVKPSSLNLVTSLVFFQVTTSLRRQSESLWMKKKSVVAQGSLIVTLIEPTTIYINMYIILGSLNWSNSQLLWIKCHQIDSLCVIFLSQSTFQSFNVSVNIDEFPIACTT